MEREFVEAGIVHGGTVAVAGPASSHGGCAGIKGGLAPPTSMNVRPLLAFLTLFSAMTLQAQTKPASKHEFATFGGGCFWCMEAVFQRLPGIVHSTSGYAGGTTSDPTYEEVCGHGTGHAEVIRVEYDPAVISYEKILEVFFEAHDPTTLNRQGNDVGTQYRSAIFYHTEEQRRTAEEVIAGVEKEHIYPNPIVTELKPATQWYEAEGYHQEYFARNPSQGYCSYVVGPKVAKFRKQFSAKLKS